MFDLYINDKYKETIESELIPRFGDIIEYDNKEYTVRKVLITTEKHITGCRVVDYAIYVA